MSPDSSRRGARSLPHLLAQVYDRHAGEAALLYEDHWLTFEESAHLAAGIDQILREAGATLGDRVILCMDNSPIARLIDQTLLGCGYVRVALSPRLHPREIAEIAADAEAAVVCCSPQREHEVDAALRAREIASVVVAFESTAEQRARLRDAAPSPTPTTRVSPSGTAMLMYSSGTTGKAKGVVVSQASWIAQTNRALAHLPPITNDDVVVLAAPMAHFAGSIGLDCLVEGARTVMLSLFDPATVMDAVSTHRATVLPLVPTLLARLLDEVGGQPGAASSLRSVPYGGSPSSVETLLAAARFLPGVLTQFYGLAEALAPLAVLSAADHDRAAATRSGTPDADAVIARLRTAGRWVPEIEHREGSQGSIRVRGNVVMDGYWKNPQLSESVLQDGWLTTGDVGRTDADGYLHILGRSSDLIISGGYNVYPREVERVIEDVDGVAEVAVLGLPDARWGEGVHAFVVLAPASPFARRRSGTAELEEAIRAACLAEIASYKKPVGIHVIDEMPRNPFGKVDRAALRAHASPADHQPPAETEQH